MIQKLALKSYSVAVSNAPEEPAYRQSRANCFRKLKQYQKAVDDLLVAIKGDSQNPELFNDLGLALHDAGNYTEAYDQFAVASKLDPENSVYWYNRGEAAQMHGDNERAVADLTKTLSLDDDPDAYAVRGRAYDALGQTRQAVSDYKRAVKLAPDVYHKYESKYLMIENKTSEPLKVFVQYYAVVQTGSTVGTHRETKCQYSNLPRVSQPTCSPESAASMASDSTSGLRASTPAHPTMSIKRRT